MTRLGGRARSAAQAVATASALSSDTLQARVAGHAPDAWSAGRRSAALERDSRMHLLVRRAGELDAPLRTAVWRLFEDNMRQLYELEGSWEPDTKYEELMDASSRYLLAVRRPEGQRTPSADTELCGYVMWRFDLDETMENDPVAEPGDERVEVAYCYELQVDAQYRRAGLGTRLLGALERLAWEAAMRKVILTVSRANEGARTFYQRHGYSRDVTSPDEEEYRDLPYIILSKPWSGNLAQSRAVRSRLGERAQHPVV